MTESGSNSELMGEFAARDARGKSGSQLEAWTPGQAGSYTTYLWTFGRMLYCRVVPRSRARHKERESPAREIGAHEVRALRRVRKNWGYALCQREVQSD